MKEAMPLPPRNVQPCILGPDTQVRGTLTGEEDLIVEGRIEGSVALSGQLVVAPEGEVQAKVDADAVVVQGQVMGDVVARNVATVEKGGFVQGKLSAPQVHIQSGAKVDGAVEMEVDLPEALAQELFR